MKKIFFENLKTLIYALLIAIIIRSFLFQPFYIPSSSMLPNLLVGDRLFVSKYTYGYTRHSLPFSPKIYSKKILESDPIRGDVIVFKTNYKNDDIFFIKAICNLFGSCKTDYIKRLIGLPGEKIQFRDGNLFINNFKVTKTKIKESKNLGLYLEKLPNGITYTVLYDDMNKQWHNSDIYEIPNNHYFFLGDNRDNSRDSRYLMGPGYVHKNDLVGKANVIFFSNDRSKGNFLQFWKWNKSIRYKRFLKRIE
tara:strand:- start:1910 stop:2662 length:753 start_codon:yes stop_codon:yes gene_type:complete